MRILALNGGSSSFKCRLDDVTGDPPSNPPKPAWETRFDLKPGAIEAALRTVPAPVDIAGHRIVHGGSYHATTLITAEVRAAIARAAEEAPTHSKFELEAIDCVTRVFGDVPQVAAFDATFHATLEPAAYVYPGPYEWLGRGIRVTDSTASVISTRRAARRKSWDSGAPGHLPSGQRSFGRGRARRQVGGHHHGFHAARRADDGHAIGVGGSRHPDLLDPPSRLQRGSTWTRF